MGVLFARVRRVFITTAVILLFLVLAGATYQGATTALERRQFPHPGRLVDVGGHQLHLYCIGAGAPTVVLEAPATGMSAAWGWVQPDVAQVTRICTYDRAGLGWSESGDRGYDPAAVPSELHTLLEQAGERAPYVVGGQGLGAALATLYAAQFAPEVAALVVIDPPGPGQPARRSLTRLLNASPWLARSGVLRATRMMSSNASGLPDVAAGPLGAFLNRPDHLTRAAAELARWDETMTLAASAVIDPSMPSARVEAAGASHTALLTDRDRSAAVAATIRDLVQRVRAPAVEGPAPSGVEGVR
jgi:pimeloyl-ACP methyl ester carboxylesterase